MNEERMSENDKIFFGDGLNLANSTLKSGVKKQSILHTTRQAQDAIDGLITALTNEARRHDIKVECRKGCSWCCHQPIFATSHEILFIWEFMKLNFNKEEIKAVLQSAFNNYQQRGKMDEQELLSSKMPCPLMKHGSCSIYPARPIVCRIYMSMSEASCKTFYNEPDHASNYPQLFEFPLQAGRMVNEGINKGLNDAGIKNREMLLEEGLLLAHNNGEPIPDTIIESPLFADHG